MLSKSDIKFLRSLSQKKIRDELGIFIVEGEKMVDEALRSDYITERVIYLKDIGIDLMSKITLLTNPSPALAIVKKRIKNDIISINPEKLYLALDSVHDPGNLGTILRIADWFGIESIIVSEDSVDIYNPKVIQASMGAIFRVYVHYTDLYRFIKSNLDNSEIYGTFLNANNIYKETLTPNGIIVMGGESQGISKDIEMLIKRRLFIPSFAKQENYCSESLNVAVATAIVCSEFRRSSVLQLQKLQ